MIIIRIHKIRIMVLKRIHKITITIAIIIINMTGGHSVEYVTYVEREAILRRIVGRIRMTIIIIRTVPQ